MEERKFKVMLARFPGNNVEHPAAADWYADFKVACYDDPRISKLESWRISDTPITMCRNRAVREAINRQADILVMLDNDMGPDQPGIARRHFWPDAFDFMVKRWDQAPTQIAVPYCGPPVHQENVYVFKWQNNFTDHEHLDFSLTAYGRDEAARLVGIQEAAALPTGLIAYDMRIFTGFTHPKTGEVLKLAPPWFDYEWTNDERLEKASTEDVFQTRNVNVLFALKGLKTTFCHWDSWAVHYKTKAVTKPTIIDAKSISESLASVVRAEGKPMLMEVGAGMPEPVVSHQPTVAASPTNKKTAVSRKRPTKK